MLRIFACQKCNVYCDVDPGMISACCQANVFIPEHNPPEIKVRTNPAL